MDVLCCNLFSLKKEAAIENLVIGSIMFTCDLFCLDVTNSGNI